MKEFTPPPAWIEWLVSKLGEEVRDVKYFLGGVPFPFSLFHHQQGLTLAGQGCYLHHVKGDDACMFDPLLGPDWKNLDEVKLMIHEPVHWLQGKRTGKTGWGWLFQYLCHMHDMEAEAYEKAAELINAYCLEDPLKILR